MKIIIQMKCCSKIFRGRWYLQSCLLLYASGNVLQYFQFAVTDRHTKREVQCILSYPNLDYPNFRLSELTKTCNVICISTTYMLLAFFTLTVFMLVLMLEVQKIKGVMVMLILNVFRIISVIRTIHFSKHLGTASRPKGFR